MIDRKNMSIEKIIKRINGYFLVEFICATLRDMNIHDKRMCNDDNRVCVIKRLLWNNNILF